MDSKKILSRVVKIGTVYLGGANPVLIQSMTNTQTLDIEATLKQSIELIEKGSAMVRITVPSMRDADALKEIKRRLIENGYQTPIIADVHFNPKIAEYCASFVEKVRINPGNYVDKKTNTPVIYTDKEYEEEINRIASRLKPLLDICKKYGTAIRIGTNHGSLSERIKNRYGDTPKGMVEATMEFLRICKDAAFYNVVVSLKASNPLIMIEANRLLLKEMCASDLYFPIHLGVTEAGEGEEGRIKSAFGIGTLLSEGIGHTIRVSLTEPPVNELPFAQLLIQEKLDLGCLKTDFSKMLKNPLWHYPIVFLEAENEAVVTYEYINKPDYIAIHNKITINNSFKENTNKKTIPNVSSCIHINDIIIGRKTYPSKTFVKGNLSDFENAENIFKIKSLQSPVVIASYSSIEDIFLLKRILSKESIDAYLFASFTYESEKNDEWLIKQSVILGHLVLNNIIDGLCFESKGLNTNDIEKVLSYTYGILQVVRKRISKTDFISCPTCGRTTFDIENILKEVKMALGHLPGLKIAVMGCVVNGPGEMADADYGYVGSAPGFVNLYKGKKEVKKNIPSTQALDILKDLIKKDGKWEDNNL